MVTIPRPFAAEGLQNPAYGRSAFFQAEGHFIKVIFRRSVVFPARSTTTYTPLGR
jgi:hypothetical protein